MVRAYLALQETMLGVVDRVMRLEVQAKQNSRNSSKPPASDGYKKPAPKSMRRKGGRRSGGQAGHNGTTLTMVTNPKAIIDVWPERCGCCDKKLSRAHANGYEARQVFDIPPVEIEVTEYRAMRVNCRGCGGVSTGVFPEQVKPGAQYGTGVEALGIYAMVYQFLPMERTGELMQELFSRAPSEGSLANFVRRCASKVKPIEAQIKAAIVNAKTLHCDETGVRVQNKLHWLHSASTNHLTYYAIDTNRAGSAFERIGILPGFKGVAVHDALPSYLKQDVTHALCNAHLLRELTALDEQTKQRWPAKLIGLLIDMKDQVSTLLEAGATRMKATQLAEFNTQYDCLVKRAIKVNPRPAYENGQRGRPRASPATNLAERLRDRKAMVLRFLHNFSVPFDNNLAERDIRMTKVKHKVSGCFRSLHGAQDFATIRGYISTLRKQGHPVLASIRALLDGTPVTFRLA